MRSLIALTIILCGVVAESAQPRSSEPADVPAAVIQELKSRGCKIPRKKSKRIIRGEFFRAGQSDWAAVCLAKKSASLLVFPGGSSEEVAVVVTRPRSFSKWSITVISQEELISMMKVQQWKGPARNEIEHQGIGSFVEFGEPGGCLYCYSSEETTHYYHQDRWITPAKIIVN